MYERFTDRSRKVMQLANQEAQRFNHEYVGTEHVLLGLVKEGSGVAANVLKNFGIELRHIRMEVEKIVKPGPEMITGKIPHTPRVKKVFENASYEAIAMGHRYIGTEHLLLGLIADSDGVASQILKNLGLDTENVREETKNLLGIAEPSSKESHTFTINIDRPPIEFGFCNQPTPADVWTEVVIDALPRMSVTDAVKLGDIISNAYRTRFCSLSSNVTAELVS